jgi:hypothetical protein
MARLPQKIAQAVLEFKKGVKACQTDPTVMPFGFHRDFEGAWEYRQRLRKLAVLPKDKIAEIVKPHVMAAIIARAEQRFKHLKKQHLDIFVSSDPKVKRYITDPPWYG